MNTHEPRLPFSALLGVALLVALAGCSDRDRKLPAADPAPKTTQSAAGEAWDKTKETAKEAYAGAKEATLDAVDKLDRATYDERMAIKANLAEAGAKIDAEMAEWKSDGKEAGVATKEKLAQAKEAFSKSLDELGEATADGWAAAKSKTAAAWVNLKAAYEQAKAEHTR